MPKAKPFEIRFPVNIDGEEKLLTPAEVYNDPKVPYGTYVTEAPFFGEVSLQKFPPTILSEDPNMIYEKYAEAFAALKDYVGARKLKIDHLAQIRLVLNKSIEDKTMFMGFVFAATNIFSNTQKQKMLKVLMQELNQDIEPVIGVLKHAIDNNCFKLAINLCGEEFFNYTDGVFPIEFTLACGRVKVDTLEVLKEFWKRGGNPNRIHRKLGTVLHMATAKEWKQGCIDLINFLANKQSKIPFDFSTRDNEGKTLLLLAAQIRSHAIVAKLCELSKQGIDVGLNIADNEGRTPLTIAAALGDPMSFEALLAAGADKEVRDQQGRGLQEYVAGGEDIIRNILKSIGIEADRDCIARSSWLYYSDMLGTPVTHEDSTNANKFILISSKEPHQSLLRKVIAEATPDSKLFYCYLQQMTAFNDNPQTLISWLNGEIAIWSKSLLDKCLEGKEAVRERFNAENITQTVNMLQAFDLTTATAAREQRPVAVASTTTAKPNKRKLGLSCRTAQRPGC